MSEPMDKIQYLTNEINFIIGKVFIGYTAEDNEGFVGRILLLFEEGQLEVSVDSDTDEISLRNSCGNKLQQYDDIQLNPSYIPNGQIALWAWVGMNQQGYCDCLLVALGGTTPTFIITAAASSLVISQVVPMRGEHRTVEE